MATYISGSNTREHALKLLTEQDAAIRAFASSWPAPRWIKIWHDGDPMPKMAWLNGAYASWYELDPHEYIGKTDAAVWPPEVVEKFHEVDLKAIQHPYRVITSLEPTPRGQSGAFCRSRKYAFRIDTDGISGWGIYGECCPLDGEGPRLLVCEHCGTGSDGRK